MKRQATRLLGILAAAGGLGIGTWASADTTITTFDNFNLDGRFANWAAATVVSTETNYSITATGYGSGYKDINPNIDATGETTIELTVTISAASTPPAPASGPIVSLVDADGTFVNYAWYGRTIGRHVLTASLNAPTSTSSPGSIPGLDLSKLDFFHLQDDPGAYSGQYTIIFENLRLTGAPRPSITQAIYNPATQEFTLTWGSLPGKTYTVLFGGAANGEYTPLQADIPSGGTSTAVTVVVPGGDAGFLRVKQQ